MADELLRLLHLVPGESSAWPGQQVRVGRGVVALLARHTTSLAVLRVLGAWDGDLSAWLPVGVQREAVPAEIGALPDRGERRRSLCWRKRWLWANSPGCSHSWGMGNECEV